MPKNKGAGGKNRRKGKPTSFKREMVYKEEGEEYGQVTKNVGGNFMDVTCFTQTGTTLRRAHIRGNMRRRVWMSAGDIVLVSVRDFEDDGCDIILKYTPDEARLLRAKKLLPDNIDIKKDNPVEEAQISFDNEEEENAELQPDKKSKVAKQERNLELPSSDSEEEDVNLDDI